MINNIKDLVTIILLIVVGIGVFQYFSVWSQNAGKLEEAKKLKADAEARNIQLTADIAVLNTEKAMFSNQIIQKEEEIEEIREEIEQLKENLKIANYGTLSTVSTDGIVKEWMEEFGLADPGISVREFPLFDRFTNEPLLNDSGKVVTEPYLVTPIDYIKLATIEKNSRESCEAQLEGTESIADLQQQITTLTRARERLEEEKNTAYIKAYEAALKDFEILHENYTTLLQAPPKIDLAPRWLQALGGLAVGGFLCSL